MNRVKVAAILIFIFELFGFIGIGKFLYHKVPIQINQLKDFEIENVVANEYIAKFTTKCPFCGDYHNDKEVSLTNEEVIEVQKTKIINLSWYYQGRKELWLILYWLVLSIGGCMAFVIFCKIMGGEFDRYSSWHCNDCVFFHRCNFYYKVNNLDFKPVKKKWYKFWGYETSSSDIDSGNNC